MIALSVYAKTAKTLNVEPTSIHGTKPTCRADLTMSVVDGVRADLGYTRPTDANDPKADMGFRLRPIGASTPERRSGSRPRRQSFPDSLI